MRIVVCDDNKEELTKFYNLIKTVAKEESLIAQINKYTGGEALLYHLVEGNSLPDVIFLDINMPDIGGIALAKKIRKMDISVPIIFLTVSDQHFLQAFDVGAFNYVLKNQQPYKRIKKILRKLQEKFEWENEDFILLTICGERKVVPLQKIYYFESRYKIIDMHYKDESFEFSSSLGKIEEELFGKEFIRIHRSFLVSISVIAEYNRTGMLLKNGVKLPIGRSYYNNIREIVGTT